jgi:hypothetical protein
MSTVENASTKGGVGEIPLDAVDEKDLGQGLLDLPKLDLLGAELSAEDLDLDDVGLGAVKGRRRRLSRKTLQKLSRLARRRRRTKTGQFMGLGASRKRRRRRRRHGLRGYDVMFGLGASRKRHRRRRRHGLRGHDVMFGLGASRKRRRRGGVSKAALRRRGRQIAKRMRRSKRTGRFVGLKGLEMLGLSGEDPSMDLFALSYEEGLGVATKRRRRRGGRARASRRRRARRMHGLDQLANVTDGLGQVEVASSMPVVGIFQWLATGPGLEALGGVALAPLVGALIVKALDLIGVKQKDATGNANVLGAIASGLVSAITMWEFGRFVGSANIAKFGSFYAIGRVLEGLVVNPLLMKPLGLEGLGDTQRIPDTAPIGYMGKIVLPDETELVGVGDTQRVPDTAPIGQVLLPEVKRPDYAVNPLSDLGTVRVDDTATIGEDEESAESIPDYEMEGEESDLF